MDFPSGENCAPASYRVEAMILLSGLAACDELRTSSCQTLASIDRRTYASRSPRLAMAGCVALFPPTGSRTGSPPEAGTLQSVESLNSPPDEKTRSRPSGVQATRSSQAC